MGKKGSWFSAIKRVFTSNSKEKPVNESEKKSSKEKKKGRGRLKHGGTRSFIPLFREPSSIEKILGEVDQQNLFIGHPTLSQQPEAQPSFSGRSASPRVTSPKAASPRVASPRATSSGADSPRITSPRVASPGVTSPRPAASPRNAAPRVVHRYTEVSYRPEPTLQHRHLSATRIQAAYRGYMARRSFRALTGLVRLQGVVRGHSVKRQTVNAMKQMQLLVRVQTQIQSRRIQMLENQALKRQASKNDKEVESSLGKNLSEMGDERWDDSLITKEEREARLRRKVEAVIKKERAMAYAYSHQLWKATPKSAQNSLMDIRSGGYPWWWNWLERQVPSDSQPIKNPQSTTTPSRPTPDHKPSPRPESSSHKQNNLSFDHIDTPTPRSSRSMVPSRTRQQMTPSRTPPSTNLNLMKYSKARGSAGGSASPYPMKDDDSLMSCPPFSVPNYMSPTVSAKAKVRPTSNPKDRAPSTPGSESSKRRFSFPLTPNSNGSFKWNKGSGSTTSHTQRVLDKHKSPGSIGDLSMDSATSMPATVGRKPFNRFV